MKRLKHFYSDLYFNKIWFICLSGIIISLIISYFIKNLYSLIFVILIIFLILTITDYFLLFFLKGTIVGNRTLPQRLSLGDENIITLKLYNTYPFKVNVKIIDELPFQFQQRDFELFQVIGFKDNCTFTYTLKPLSRGIYEFGELWCFVNSPIRLLQKRINSASSNKVKVYPSFLHLRKYQLLAKGGSLLPGVKKIRKLGHSLEFEKIKDYVQGDDIRTINWKATARNNQLMVNTFIDSKQQQIYCFIDKGRNMKMPFEGMSLLDYAINATLALLNVALLKQDKVGLITFSNMVNDVIIADRKNNEMQKILETLYNQTTDFKDCDYEALWIKAHQLINQRAFIILFTNFESITSMERQLPYLKSMTQRHLVCVVFFQNTMLKEIHENNPDTLEGIYIKTIADQFDFEKRQIVKELRKHGILSVLTTPENLTVDVINHYLELKAKEML